MEKLFSDLIELIKYYFSVIGILIFDRRKASILIFSPLYNRKADLYRRQYIILLLTVLYIFAVRVVIQYYRNDVDKSYISSILNANYFNEEGFFRIFVSIIPFVILINFLCFIFISKRNRKKWIAYYILNFSSQIFVFITVGDIVFLFDNKKMDFGDALGVVVLIVIIAFVFRSFKILKYAYNYKLIKEEPTIFSNLFAITLPFLFYYLFSFSSPDNHVSAKIMFPMTTDDSIATVNIDSINPEKYKLSINAYIVNFGDKSLIFGVKKRAFMATWPLLNKEKEDDGTDAIGLDIQSEEKDAIFAVKSGELNKLSLYGFANLNQLRSLTEFSKSKDTNGFKIIGKVDKVHVNFFNDRVRIKGH